MTSVSASIAAMADRPDALTSRTPLARRTPVEKKDALETEEPAVVSEVAALLGRWVDDDRS